MRGARHHAEIMDEDRCIQISVNAREHRRLRIVDLLIIGGNRIHVNHRRAVQFLGKAVFDGIDHIVQRHDIAAGGHFGVQRNHHAPRAVIMHRQIMYAHDIGVFAHDIADALHKFGRRRIAQQRRNGILRRRIARAQNHDRHQRARPRIDIYAEEAIYQHGNQHRRRSAHIGQAIRRHGAHRGGIDLLPHRAVVDRHIELYQYRSGEDDHGYDAKFHLFRLDDLPNGIPPQRKAHQQNHHRNDQSRHIFNAPVPVGMIAMRLLRRQLKAQQRDHR